MNIEQIENLTAKWKKLLKLQDWDIKIQIVETIWRKTGDIKIDEDDQKAVLMLNSSNPKQENLEEVIIHELLHLRLWKLDQMIEQLIRGVFGSDSSDPKYEFAYTAFMTNLESTVENLTKSFLSLGGENKELSFGRIMQEVKKEMDKKLIK